MRARCVGLTAELTAERESLGVTARYAITSVRLAECVIDVAGDTQRYAVMPRRGAQIALHTRGVAGSNPVPPTNRSRTRSPRPGPPHPAFGTSSIMISPPTALA